MNGAGLAPAFFVSQNIRSPFATDRNLRARRARFCSGNVLAVGAALCFTEPGWFIPGQGIAVWPKPAAGKAGGSMVSRVTTVAFEGVEAVPVDVQVMVAPGKVGMQIVGLADKAVTESRERIQAALHASGLSMPAKKVTVNLAPADLPKEGSQ